jgi:hypothetical protein
MLWEAEMPATDKAPDAIALGLNITSEALNWLR